MKKLIVLALILSFNASASNLSYAEFSKLSDDEKCILKNFPSRDQMDSWIEGEIGNRADRATVARMQKEMHEQYIRYCISRLNSQNLELKFEVEHGYKP